MKNLSIFLNGEYNLPNETYLKYLQQSDYIICADGGYDFLKILKVKPDLLLGDFDSISAEIPEGINVKKYPADKDMGDGELALQEAIKHKPKKIYIFGGLGGRLDHELVNFFVVESHIHKKLTIEFIDKFHNLIFTKSKILLTNKKGLCVSLLPITMGVKIKTKGFRWNVDGSLKRASSKGLSNIIIDKKAIVDVKKGLLLIVINCI